MSSCVHVGNANLAWYQQQQQQQQQQCSEFCVWCAVTSQHQVAATAAADTAAHERQQHPYVMSVVCTGPLQVTQIIVMPCLLLSLHHLVFYTVQLHASQQSVCATHSALRFVC
jgi:hypothetical protein